MKHKTREKGSERERGKEWGREKGSKREKRQKDNLPSNGPEATVELHPRYLRIGCLYLKQLHNLPGNNTHPASIVI